MFQGKLSLPEPASEHIERLLAQVCPIHIGTTLDGGPCPMCELENRPAPVTSPWVRRAAEDRLPSKVYAR